MIPGRVFALLSFSILAAALICGCASSTALFKPKGGKLYAVTAESTPFYYYGPKQGSGPDKTIPKDTPMKLIRISFGCSKVELLTGEVGYVATDDIAAASSDLIASLNTGSKKLSSAFPMRGASPEPRFEMPPEPPLPEFEPTPIPVPLNLGN
jgi:hypothetical protein